MFSREEVLRAKEIYLSEHDEILIPVQNRNIGYVFAKRTLSWNVTKIHYSWKVYCKSLAGDEAIALMDNWELEAKKKNSRIDKAIAFAVQKHSGQFRRGTTVAHIFHPLEVMQILCSMGADDNLMIAGILHEADEGEKSDEELRKKFGADVANLVCWQKEDKSKSWEERKIKTAEQLSDADVREKMLVMADVLSDLRTMAQSCDAVGNIFWDRFEVAKEKICLYYDGVLDALYDMQFVSECEKAYWEITGLFKDIFVRYYSDSEKNIIYQVCDTGTIHYLKKGNPAWNDALAEMCDNIAVSVDDTPHYYKTNFIPDNARSISRKEAELTEDIWSKPFWDCHNTDLQDGEYPLFYSKKRCVDIKISNSCLVLFCEDYGKECESINGNSEYEFSYSLDEECTQRFLVQLRIKKGTDDLLGDVLKQEFGKENGPGVFKSFCDDIGVTLQFYSR